MLYWFAGKLRLEGYMNTTVVGFNVEETEKTQEERTGQPPPRPRQWNADNRRYTTVSVGE